MLRWGLMFARRQHQSRAPNSIGVQLLDHDLIEEGTQLLSHAAQDRRFPAVYGDMNKKSWLLALVALVLGAAVAVAITQSGQDDTKAAAPSTETTDTEKSSDSKENGSKGSSDEEEEKAADEEEATEQQVEQTVNTYVEALEQGDTEAACNIQTESLTVDVTASGVSGEQIAEACAEAASQFDWAELWADWASQIDLDDVQVKIDGAEAKVSLDGGASFSLDRQKSGEWKIDGVRLRGAGSGRSAPQGDGLPSGGNPPSGGNLPSGGNVPSGGGHERPSPQIPESPQLPQSPPRPQR